MYSTRTRVHACIPNGLTRKSARVGQVGGQVGEDRRACPARGKLNGDVAARRGTLISTRGEPRAEVGDDIRVGVGPMELKLYPYPWTY